MVECNPIKKISAWQLEGEGTWSNFQPSREIRVGLRWSAGDRGDETSSGKVPTNKSL